MKALIIGSTGLLGQTLKKSLLDSGHDVKGVARKNSDYNIDIIESHSLKILLHEYEPDLVINCAAIVNLSLCEENPLLAYQVNSIPSQICAEYTRGTGAYYIYISTDHFYNDGNTQHSEADFVNLCNEYCRSKFLGESLTAIDPNACILRTNIVGFRGWKNQPSFLEWAISALKNNQDMELYTDYYTSSIDVGSLSAVLQDLIQLKPSGTYNLASRTVSNKKEFIQRLAAELNLNTSNCKDSNMMDSHSGISRNNYLGLNVSKIEILLGYNMPDINQVINAIGETYRRKKKE